MSQHIKCFAIFALSDNQGKEAIYDFLHSTKIYIDSEIKLGLKLEESPYVFASQRQSLCGSLPLSTNYKTLTKTVSQVSVCTISFNMNVVLGGNTDQQI